MGDLILMYFFGCYITGFVVALASIDSDNLDVSEIVGLVLGWPLVLIGLLISGIFKIINRWS